MQLESRCEKSRREQSGVAAGLSGQALAALVLASGSLLGGCTEVAPPATGEVADALTFPGHAAEWIPVVRAAGPVGDSAADAPVDAKNLVGNAAFPAVFYSHSGSELFFRMRLQANPLTSGGLHYASWGVLLNTDGNADTYEYSLRVDATTNPARIVYARNQQVDAFDDPTDVAERELAAIAVNMSSGARNVTVAAADSCFDAAGAAACAGANDSNRDYFLDFGVPVSIFALPPAPLDLSQPIQILAGSSCDGSSMSFDLAGCEDKPGPSMLSECQSDPMWLACGNGHLDAGEGCDDGNRVDGDGCNARCLIEDSHPCNDECGGATGDASCASGVCDTTGGEPGMCEPANACGNGRLDAGEGCDDGNTAAGDGCNAHCLVEDGAACNAEAPGATGDASCEHGSCDVAGTCGPRPGASPETPGPGAPGTPDTGTSGLGISGGGCSAGAGGAGSGASLLVMLGLAMVRSRRRRRSLAALGGLLVAGGVTATSGEAAAQVSTQYTAERFELTGYRDGILGVEWADVRGHLTYDAGMWLGYANDPVNVYEMSTGTRVGALVHNRVGGDLVAALRLWDRIELGVGVPMVVSQSADLGAAAMLGTDLSGGGIGDLRLSSKVTLARRGGTALAVMAGLGLPTSTLDYGGDRGLTVSPALVASHVRGGLRLAANVGYRTRPTTQALNLTVDDEVYVRTGVGYRFPSSVELDATFDVATAANDVLGAFNRNHAELRGGVAYDVTSTVRVFGAAGAGVAEGFGTPDWRALAGIRLSSGSKKHARRAPRVPEPTPAPALEPAPAPEPAPELPPAPDRDHDRVPDVDDRCPTEPGLPEHDGCPVNTRVETGKIVILKRVEFATDADVILPRSFPILQEVAVVLKANPEIKRLRIEGHTDDAGAEAYNLDLSRRRAHSVKRWLVEVAKIDASRLEALGCGESLPITSNATAEGRQENRRVEFPILDPAPELKDRRDLSKCSAAE